MIEREEILTYHSRSPAGKLEVIPSKPCLTQRDLSIAYTPGVATPCLEIRQEAERANLYTGRSNLVAVVTNGTAVLGLGNIGALAGKPVMEGKAVLFKRFADIDAFDLELDTEDQDEIVKTVRLLEPTFGAINLEDVRAPECFYIEEQLKKSLSIPIFHDDQHGTAIVAGAALLNAIELTGRDISRTKVVYSGAGAGGLACATFHRALGVRPENMLVCDTAGVIYEGRTTNMNSYKQRFAVATDRRTLKDALEGADVFLGLSSAGIVTPGMVGTMAESPIIFALANPDPEIPYDEARAVRPDAIVATGRSDYPNQVNNVLGFPGVFRGALDVHATRIDEEMKIAATRALAGLVREHTPDEVLRAYDMERLDFGPEYIIPKPFDPRVVLQVAPAVAEAAIRSGAAGRKLDHETYRAELESRLGRHREVVRVVMAKAAHSPKRIVFPEGNQERVLRACRIVAEEGIAKPIVLGSTHEISILLDGLGLPLETVEIIDPMRFPRLDQYVNELHSMRARKGMTREDAADHLRHRHYFGPMMIHMGDADGLIGGLVHQFSDTLRPAIQIIGLEPGIRKVAGLYVMLLKNEVLFFADSTVNIDPSDEDLAEIAIQSAGIAREFDVDPRVAMLSFSNFGSSRHSAADKVRRAVELIREIEPDLCVEGEMQGDVALSPETIQEFFPFSKLQERANVLVFPEIQSANLAFRLVKCLGDAEAIGPILMGLRRPVHLLQHNASVDQIVQMTALTVVDAQEHERRRRTMQSENYITSSVGDRQSHLANVVA